MNVDIKTNWEIRYSRYVGVLVLFDESIYRISKESLKTEIVDGNDTKITFDRANGEPLMIQMPNPSRIIPNIDDMEKIYIINKVKEYILNARKTDELKD